MPASPGDALTIPSSGGASIVAHPLGGNGPLLLICHATGFHGRSYGPMAQELVDDFTVWALDLRGHGAATAPDDEDFGWQGMADDVLVAIDTLGADSACAVGHSMGGAAILLAEMARPGTIDAAYLFEPIVFPAQYLLGRDENPMAGPARKRREVFESRDAALARYASRPPLNTLRADALHAYVEFGFDDLADGQVRLACRAEHEARTFECDVKLTLERVLGLDLSVMVAAGMVAGSPNPADFAPLLVEAMPEAELVMYEHLGHFGPLEAPGIIGADAARFLLAATDGDDAGQ